MAGFLTNKVVEWSINKVIVRPDDVLRELGLKDRFIESLKQNFPVDIERLVPVPHLADAIGSALDRCLPGTSSFRVSPAAEGRRRYPHSELIAATSRSSTTASSRTSTRSAISGWTQPHSSVRSASALKFVQNRIRPSITARKKILSISNLVWLLR
jgi:hypothetical protein